MRPGRLVYLSDYFGAGGAATGGAGIASLESFEILAKAGAQVQMIAGYFAPDAVAGHAEVTRLGGEDLRSGSRGAGLRAIYNPASRRALARVLNDFDPHDTVIVLHQWTRWLSPSAVGLLSRFKLLVYMHDYFWFCPNGAYYNFRTQRPCELKPMGAACIACACNRSGYGHKLGRLARQTMKTLTLGGAPSQRAFLHISELSRRIAADLMPGETHRLVHNPLPHALLGEPPGPTAEPPYDVGFFGRLEPEKGVMDLCEAVQRNGRRAVFVGSGSLRDTLVERLGPGAVIGWTNPADALALMLRCRVVALPSRWPETWGLVVAEAMALGRPVLVSCRAGASELVQGSGGGLVFDPGRPGDLHTALEALLQRGAISDERKAAAARSVRRLLDPALHARRMIGAAAELWDLDVGPRPACPEGLEPPPISQAEPAAAPLSALG